MTYPTWKTLRVDLAPRAPLRTLGPLGRGTARSESLSSYVSRLAALYGIPPSLFFRNLAEFIPEERRETIRNPWPGTFNLTGAGWIPAIERCSGQTSLDQLALKPWLGAIRTRRLLRRSHAWCPGCLKEWAEDGTSSYEPLCWMLECVSVCAEHRCSLATRCPGCQKELRISWNMHVPRRCSWCLADLAELAEVPLPEGDQAFRLWCAEQAGALMTSPGRPRFQLAGVQNCLNGIWTQAREWALDVAARQPADYAPSGSAFDLTLLADEILACGMSAASGISADWKWLYPSRLELFMVLSFCCRVSILELIPEGGMLTWQTDTAT